MGERDRRNYWLRIWFDSQMEGLPYSGLQPDEQIYAWEELNRLMWEAELIGPCKGHPVHQG